MEATTDTIESLSEALEQEQARFQLSTIRNLRESIDLFQNYVGNKDDDSEEWLSLGITGEASREVAFDNEQELTLARQRCRVMARENPFAISAIKNRVAYVVGTGHTYKAAEIKGQTLADGELQALQDVIDEFIEANRWHWRQQEMRRRLDRDGEVFLRIFEGVDTILVRFVEPGQVQQPENRSGDHYSFGVETQEDDVETVLAYWIDKFRVEATEIQHRKANVDATCKRGIPTLWAPRSNFDRAGKLLRNMSVVAATQAAIAIIRKHNGASNSQITAFAASNTVATKTNPVTGQQSRYKQAYRPGTILDANANTDYEFPVAGVNAANMVGILQAELRAIASCLVMPEYMLSADASNANYSSTLVAGGPANMTFTSLQAETKEFDLEILERVIALAITQKRLNEDILERAYVDITAPTIEVVDPLNDARKKQIEHQEGALSVKTWRGQIGLDDDVEEANFEAEREAAVEHAQALAPPPDPGADTQQGGF